MNKSYSISNLNANNKKEQFKICSLESFISCIDDKRLPTNLGTRIKRIYSERGENGMRHIAYHAHKRTISNFAWHKNIFPKLQFPMFKVMYWNASYFIAIFFIFNNSYNLLLIQWSRFSTIEWIWIALDKSNLSLPPIYKDQWFVCNVDFKLLSTIKPHCMSALPSWCMRDEWF